MKTPHHPAHYSLSRRTAIQAGSIGLLGLGMNHLPALQAAKPRARKAKNVIYIFLSGGLAQHESFDMKPNAPKEVVILNAPQNNHLHVALLEPS